MSLNSSDDNEKGFFQYGNEKTNLDYEYEDALVGDKEGLIYLRSKIDEALKSEKKVFFSSDDIDTDFTYLKLGKKIVPEEEEGSALIAWGCILAALLIVVIFVLGIIKLIDLLISMS